MKSYIFASLLLFVGIAFAAESIATSPVFLWSNSQYFNGKNVQVKSLTPVQSLQETIFKSDFVSQSQKPETLIVFIQPHLRSDEFVTLAAARGATPNGGVFANLKTLVESSTSSLVIPNVLPASEGALGSHLVQELVSVVDGSVTFVSTSGKVEGAGDAKQIKMDDFLSTVPAAKNGKTDLIVVYMNAENAAHLATDDAKVQKFCQHISGQSYVAVFGAKSMVNKPLQKRFTEEEASVRQLSKRLTPGLVYIAANMWNSSIVTALLISLPFILILAVGLCCVFDIQSEPNFEKPLSSKKNL